MDFIGLLPEDEGFNCIVSFTNRLNSDIQIILTRTDISAEDLAVIFFNEWYCKNGLPLEIVSDRDKMFLSKFWQSLHGLTGVKLKMSTVYHPESDGTSEQSNKTINQCLQYHVECNQMGWRCLLPQVCFNIMNTINASTGFSPFHLQIGRSPCMIPLLICSEVNDLTDICTTTMIERLQLNVLEAKDNMLWAKISQSLAANEHCTDAFPFETGSRVVLLTLHWHQDYKVKDEK